jgi:hypothetical protein
MIAAVSRSPSRLSARLVTCDRPAHGALNSGRKVYDEQHRNVVGCIGNQWAMPSKPRDRRNNHVRSPCLPRSVTVVACAPLSPGSSAKVTREPTVKRENPSASTLLRWK